MNPTDQEKIDAARADFAIAFGNGVGELKIKTSIYYRYARFELGLRNKAALEYVRLCIDHGESHYSPKRFYLWYYKDQLDNTDSFPEKN